MDKIWVKDAKEGDRLKSVFLVGRKALPTAKNGKTYLALTLQDKTGELEARAFERVEELSQGYEERDILEVEGQVGSFQGKAQLRVETLLKLDPAAVEASELVWSPPPEPKKPERTGPSEAEEASWKELLGLVEVVADPHVKALLQAFLQDDDLMSRLRRAPAAKSVHHAYPGGLLEHTVSCLKLAHRLADHYPQIDRDLLVAGAFFHDLGKVRELSYDRQVEYSDEGRLIGHLVMTAQWIHDKARRVGVPRELEHHIVHLVLAHHGRLEYGSPKLPMTLEALLTHAIDELDSRVSSWLNLMGREGGSRRWTDSKNVYEQHIWRGTLPTVQAEKRGPGPELMTPVIYVPHGAASPQPHAGERPPQGPGGKKRRPDRPERRPEPRPESASAAADASAPPPPAPAAGPSRSEGSPAERPPRPERAPRPDRPPDRPDRGGFRGGGSGGPGGPGGDRKRAYMGPRLPGDRGPQPRPKTPGALTHNPFAALAQKIEGGAAAGQDEAAPPPAEAAVDETPREAPPEVPSQPEPGPASPSTGEDHSQGGAFSPRPAQERPPDEVPRLDHPPEKPASGEPPEEPAPGTS